MIGITRLWEASTLDASPLTVIVRVVSGPVASGPPHKLVGFSRISIEKIKAIDPAPVYARRPSSLTKRLFGLAGLFEDPGAVRIAPLDTYGLIEKSIIFVSIVPGVDNFLMRLSAISTLSAIITTSSSTVISSALAS